MTATRLNEEQVKVFDDVLCLLIARVESRARAEFGKRLAPVDYAPSEVMQHLAWDDEIAVAGDVLAHSSRLQNQHAGRDRAARRGRIICSPFRAAPTCPKPSPT